MWWRGERQLGAALLLVALGMASSAAVTGEDMEVTRTATPTPEETTLSAPAEATAGAEEEAQSGWARVAQLVRGCRLPAADADAQAEGALKRLQRCLVDAALTCARAALREERLQLAPGVELVRLQRGGGAREAGGGSDGGAGPLGAALALLRSYALRVSPAEAAAEQAEGRLRRHHYKHMFPLMVMSFMALSAFMVPMGFQFMAVLGGKALLLSKMSLLVASLLSYKKVATDFTHHHHGHGHHSSYDPFYYGWHDRTGSNKWL